MVDVIINEKNIDEKEINITMNVVKQLMAVTWAGLKDYCKYHEENNICEFSVGDYVDNVGRNYIVTLIWEFTEKSDFENVDNNCKMFLEGLRNTFDKVLPLMKEKLERDLAAKKNEVH